MLDADGKAQADALPVDYLDDLLREAIAAHTDPDVLAELNARVERERDEVRRPDPRTRDRGLAGSPAVARRRTACALGSPCAGHPRGDRAPDAASRGLTCGDVTRTCGLSGGPSCPTSRFCDFGPRLYFEGCGTAQLIFGLTPT